MGSHQRFAFADNKLLMGHIPMEIMLDTISQVFMEIFSIGVDAAIAAGCVYGLNKAAESASALKPLKNAPVIKLEQDGDLVQTVLGNEGTIGNDDPFYEAYIPYAAIEGTVGSLNLGRGNNSLVSVGNGTSLTAVGELVVSTDGREVKVQPPSSGSKFHLVPESLDALIRHQEGEIRKQYLILILSGSLVVGLMLGSGYRIYKIYRSKSSKSTKNEKKDPDSSKTDSSKTDSSKTASIKIEGSKTANVKTGGSNQKAVSPTKS